MNACLFNKSTHDSVVYFVVVQFLLKCDTSQVVRCRETPEIRCRKAQVAEAPGKVSFFTGNSILDVEEKLLFRGRQLKWTMFGYQSFLVLLKMFLIVKRPVWLYTCLTFYYCFLGGLVKTKRG